MHSVLQTLTLGEFLSHRPPSSVIEVHTEMTLSDALDKLSMANVLSAPCRDASQGYIGFTDVSDILRALLNMLAAEESRDSAVLKAGWWPFTALSVPLHASLPMQGCAPLLCHLQHITPLQGIVLSLEQHAHLPSSVIAAHCSMHCPAIAA